MVQRRESARFSVGRTPEMMGVMAVPWWVAGMSRTDVFAAFDVDDLVIVEDEVARSRSATGIRRWRRAPRRCSM